MAAETLDRDETVREFHDAVIMAILAREWEERHPPIEADTNGSTSP